MSALTGIAAAVREANKQTAAAAEANAAAAEAAGRAVDQAEAQAKAAHQAELTARNQVRAKVGGLRRQLGDELSAARQAAVQAVYDGRDPLGAWLAYRRLGARIAGTWQAATANVPGAGNPPGMPPLAGPPDAEPFHQFVTRALATAEKEITNRAAAETRGQIERAAQENVA